MTRALQALAENTRLMRQFGDELHRMPALWAVYQRNRDLIRLAEERRSAARQPAGA